MNAILTPSYMIIHCTIFSLDYEGLVEEVLEAMTNKEEIERNTAHIMMVGFPGTGKTSLVDNLLGRPPKSHTSTGVCGSLVVVDVDTSEPTTLNAALIQNSDYGCTWKPITCNEALLVQIHKCRELASKQAEVTDQKLTLQASSIPTIHKALVQFSL